MLGRHISPTYLAGVAVAALAHTGMAAGFFLMDHASGAGRASADSVFIVTLVDFPEAEPVVELQPEPAPVVEPEQPDVPEPAETVDVKAAVSEPAPVMETEVLEPPAAQADAGFVPAEDAAQPVSDASVEMIEEGDALPADHLPEAAQPSSAQIGVEGEGNADMDDYLRGVRLLLARHAPRGVSGARNCEVEFRLSRTGEVVFVGIRTSSGSPLYDRRCMRSVTAAVPFPSAPSGATAEDLSFTIVMKQKP